MFNWVIFAPITAVISILFGGWLFYKVYQAPTGTEAAARVQRAIAEGANAYLRILYIALVVVSAILAIVLGAGKLPEAARGIGKAFGAFKKAEQDVRDATDVRKILLNQEEDDKKKQEEKK